MVTFYIFLCFFATEAARLHLQETTIGPITEQENGFLTLSLENDDENPWKEALVKLLSLTPQQISLENDTFFVTEDDLETGRNITVNIHALVMGHGKILIQVYGNVNNGTATGEYLEAIVKVRVARKVQVIDTVFLIFIGIFMIINNINMGCILDLNIIKEVFRKPIGPIIGFCSQFLFMPLAAFGFAHAFFTTPALRLGLFALGCSPGGTGSNFWTLLLGGDLNLSVVMTFFSTIAALGMMPFWLFTLGQEFFDDIHIPYISLFTTLVSLILPVGVGVLIRHFRPRWAKFAEKIIRPFTVTLLLFFMTVGVYCNLHLFKLFTWQVVMAGVCVAWGGYIFGALASWLLRMKVEQIIAISIETAFQNPGIAFLVLKLTIPPPDADLASVSPVGQLIVTGFPCWVAYIVMCIRRRLNAPPEPSKKNCFRKVFEKNEPNESDAEELEEQKTPKPDMWISVPIRDEDEQDKMIRTFADGEEDLVWQR